MTSVRLTRRELLFIAASLGIGLTMEHPAWAATESASKSWPPPGAGAQDVPPRRPQYPLKTARMLYTDAEVSQARANIAHYPAAKAVSEKIAQAAEPWLDWEDADLLWLLTPASVPRSFDLNASVGCPKCGKEIYKFGTYPWIVDPKKPFKLTCPVDGSVYPSNDYETYYRSGFKKKKGWDTQYVDDGWGWLSPGGERYWFVAHANHQVWKNVIGPGMLALAHAYLLTGDRRYARTAAVMLSRTAQVYPAMDYEHQSRYGLMQAARGNRYPGKILNLIWETGFASGIAQAYDAVWETIDADTSLQKLLGKSGRDIRAFIEANFLEDAVDAYYAGKIAGNFGMHQDALCNIALARQHGANEKWLGGILTNTQGNSQHLGINYALYDLIYREGIPSETSPGYNFSWVASLTGIASLLQKSGRDLFTQPRMRLLYDGVLDIINARKFTPDLGDTGSVYGGLEGENADVFQTAYRVYHDERYAAFLASFGATGNGGYKTFQSLFLPPIAAKSAALAPQRPRLLDSYGVGILNNPKDSISTTLTYGLKAGHGHYDRLNFEMFAVDQPIMPDLGYPDAMNDYVSGIYTWSKNTISHNTVVVDASRQMGNVHGTVKLFAAGPFARVLDVDAPGTYPQATTYRRALLMVDTGKHQSYYLDIFNVTGGKQHDYSLHGPPGAFTMQGGQWSDPAPGTLAGENVALGQLYDDPVMGKPGYNGGYGTYVGSGFQYLFHVQTRQGGDWVAEWQHEKDPAARLRIRTLPQPGQQMMMADAHVSPVKFPQIVKYLIARRAGNNLTSRFISVLEPYRKTPILTAVQPLDLADGRGIAVEARRADGLTDILLYDPEGTSKRLKIDSGEIVSDARAAVVTANTAGKITRVFFTGGTTLTVAGKTHVASPGMAGRVVSVDPLKNTIRILPDAQSAHADPKTLAGGEVFFHNDLHHVAYRAADAFRDGKEWVLMVRGDVRIARIPVQSVEKGGAAVTSAVSLPLDPTYVGGSLAGLDFLSYHLVTDVSDTGLTLAAPLPAASDIAAGKDAWIVGIAPGDRLEMPSLYVQADA